MQKSLRQNALVNLISAERITGQAELVDRLRSRDLVVTQASISRDLDELGIIKTAGVYTLPRRPSGASAVGLRSIENAGDSLVVVKCDSGLASAAAVKIDASRIPEIIGTIAGDDTIFIAVKDEKAQKSVSRAIWEIFDQ